MTKKLETLLLYSFEAKSDCDIHSFGCVTYSFALHEFFVVFHEFVSFGLLLAPIS